jgi:hypothetical protein
MFYPFVDAGGRYRSIYGCPLKQRQELARGLMDLEQAVLRSHYRTHADLYDHDLHFRAIAEGCLAICRVDPDWLDIDLLVEFLLPSRGEDGSIRQPLLAQLNQISTGVGGQTFEEAIAEVWHSLGDYHAALRAVGYAEGEVPPWDTLVKIMQARLDLLYPQAKMERDAFADLASSMETGDFFKAFSNLAPDEIFKGLTTDG